MRPRNPLNIGAAARAMANFGLTRLTVVAPYAPHWREARSAVGAPELLAEARLTENLAEACAQATLVLGTGTSSTRKAEQPILTLPDLPALLDRELASGGRIAIVFGPEKHGLTREDLALCHRMIEIPTSSHQPSMNLGQAVAVCLYEMTIHAGLLVPLSTTPTTPATSERLERLADLVAGVMASAHYSPLQMQGANRHDLTLMLRRLAPTDHDTRRLLGLFRRIEWQLKKNPSSSD